MTNQAARVGQLLSEALPHFRAESAVNLGQLDSTDTFGWIICPLWRQQLSEGPYDSYSTAHLCLTTGGSLVECFITYHEENNQRLDYLRDLSTDVQQLDYEYTSTTSPSGTYWRDEEGSMTVSNFGGQRVVAEDFDGLRDNLKAAYEAQDSKR